MKIAWGVPGIVLETGCTRGITGDGNSTPTLAAFAAVKKVKFYSCDISRKALDNAMRVTGNRTEFICQDSKEWLKTINEPVSLCYLDSYDYDEANPEPCQDHQLAEFLAIKDRISVGGCMLLDDAGLPHGGKCAKTQAWITLYGGWRLNYQGYQLLYVKQK